MSRLTSKNVLVDGSIVETPPDPAEKEQARLMLRYKLTALPSPELQQALREHEQREHELEELTHRTEQLALAVKSARFFHKNYGDLPEVKPIIEAIEILFVEREIPLI